MNYGFLLWYAETIYTKFVSCLVLLLVEIIPATFMVDSELFCHGVAIDRGQFTCHIVTCNVDAVLTF